MGESVINLHPVVPARMGPHQSELLPFKYQVEDPFPVLPDEVVLKILSTGVEFGDGLSAGDQVHAAQGASD